MPKISVIVPIYNVEKYIYRCIDSILAQSFSDFELILVDDGSPDRCGEICEEYAKKDSRIKVIHQKNQGQAAARNNGMKVAVGEWIHFVDGDDMIHPKMLEILYDAVITKNVKLSMCSCVEAETVPEDFYKSKEQEIITYEMTEERFIALRKNNGYKFWVVWGKLIHREIVEKYPFEAGRFYEDTPVSIQWFYEVKTVADTNAELYFYAINSSGTTKSEFNRKRLDVLWAFEQKLDFCKRIGFEELRKCILKTYLYTAIEMYKKVNSSEKTKSFTPDVAKSLKTVFERHKKYIPDGQCDYIYNIIHPIRARIKDLVKATLRKVGKN